MPLIQLRSFTNLPPPLISHNKNNGSEAPLFCCDSFPPGEAERRTTIDCSVIFRQNSLLPFITFPA